MRTALTLKRLSLLCAGPMLLACANLSDHFALPDQQAVARSADDAYQLGRNYHLAHKYDDALRAYREALAVDPQHVNARNGMATLYAERRAFNQAIPIWRELTAPLSVASGPSQAYLFSNLGYAYFLNGQYADAVAALEKACLLDPLSYSAWFHLGESLQKLGQEQRAQEMFRQAAALQAHDVRADLSVVGSAVPAVVEAAQAPARAGDEWAATDIVTGADGLLELRRVPAVAVVLPISPPLASAPLATPLPLPTAPVPMPVAPEPLPSAPAPLPALPALLEIRNGNGVTGMARALAARMGDPALKVVRLTNEKGFAVPQTRVEYQSGFRSVAQRLAARFDHAVVQELPNCGRAQLRLVLGHDSARKDFVLHPLPTVTPMLADAGITGGKG